MCFMIRSANKMIGFSVHATDGEIGNIQDFIYDENEWSTRYVVVEIEEEYDSRFILLSTTILGPSALAVIGSNLTMREVANCPAIGLDEIPTRAYEQELHNYFALKYYWASENASRESSNLQRFRSIEGCHLKSSYGDIGYLSDLLIDDVEWVARYCVLDFGSLFTEKRVLVSPLWIHRIGKDTFQLDADINHEKLYTAPSYDSNRPLLPEHEAAIFRFFDRRPYWET